jgi:hypothetical protein
MIWTAGQVRALGAIVCCCVLFVACGAAKQNAHELANTGPGIVTGIREAEVSTSPGSAPSRKMQGNLALLIETREAEGRKWSHVIGSDGTHGWLPSVPTVKRAVTVVPAIRAFALRSASPDDPAFNSGSDVAVEPKTSGVVLGGSVASYPAFPQDIMVPERLSYSIGPWLKLKFGEVTGFAPPEWVSLRWEYQIGQASNVAQRLQELGMTGMVRRAFLSPVEAQLKALIPAGGARVQHAEEAGKPLDSTSFSSERIQPDATFSDVGSAGQGLRTLLVFRGDNSLLCMFIHAVGGTSPVWIEDGARFVSQVQTIDLNHDGIADWLLEVVHTYGDGFYSELWIVNGNSKPGRLQVERAVLSHTPNESGASPSDSAWWVSPDAKLWIVTAERKTNAASYSYSDHLAPSHTPSKTLAIFSETAQFIAAGENQLKVAKDGEAAGVFPLQSAGVLHWVVARPFDSFEDAKHWAAGKPSLRARLLTLPGR